MKSLNLVCNNDFDEGTIYCCLVILRCTPASRSVTQFWAVLDLGGCVTLKQIENSQRQNDNATVTGSAPGKDNTFQWQLIEIPPPVSSNEHTRSEGEQIKHLLPPHPPPLYCCYCCSFARSRRHDGPRIKVVRSAARGFGFTGIVIPNNGRCSWRNMSWTEAYGSIHKGHPLKYRIFGPPLSPLFAFCLISGAKFTQLYLQCLLLTNLPMPLGVDVLYGWSLIHVQ